MNLSLNQQALLTRSLMGVGLGCSFVGILSFYGYEICACVDGRYHEWAKRNINKWESPENWVRVRLHLMLVKVRQELNFYKKSPEVLKTIQCVETALRLTGSKVRMTESESIELLNTL